MPPFSNELLFEKISTGKLTMMAVNTMQKLQEYVFNNSVVCLLLFGKPSKYHYGIILNYLTRTWSANVLLLRSKKHQEDVFINSFSVFSVLFFLFF